MKFKNIKKFEKAKAWLENYVPTIKGKKLLVEYVLLDKAKNSAVRAAIHKYFNNTLMYESEVVNDGWCRKGAEERWYVVEYEIVDDAYERADSFREFVFLYYNETGTSLLDREEYYNPSLDKIWEQIK